jgi:hypothetical protein
LDFKLTCQVAQAGLGNSFFLDSVNFRQKAFRLKLLYKSLPTNAIVCTWKKYALTDPVCQRCLAAPETMDHLFECSETRAILPNLLSAAVQTITKNKATKFTYKALRSAPLPVPPIELLNALGCTDERFLAKPLAKGIVHEFDVYRFQLALGPCVPNSTIRLWLTLTLDAWLTSCYELIWKPRNRVVFG